MMSTLLPGNSVILVSTRTAYLPRLKYWSVRYCFTSSSTERSKVLPWRKAHVAQALLQVLGLDVLVALDLELGDGGPLDHHDQQGVAVAAQFHVAKEAGRVQRPHGFADALAVEVIADVHRQVVEYRAFGDSLQAFDADVADRERVSCAVCARTSRPQGLDGKRHQASQTQFKPHATTTDCYFDRS